MKDKYVTTQSLIEEANPKSPIYIVSGGLSDVTFDTLTLNEFISIINKEELKDTFGLKFWVHYSEEKARNLFVTLKQYEDGESV